MARDAEQQPLLSIIIPARNEEHRLPPALTRIAAYLRTQPYRSEVIVVENGSTDATSGITQRFIAEQVQADDPFTMRLLHSGPGKGAAVKKGMLAGQGEYLVICDTDLAVPIEEVAKFLPPALPAQNYGIAIASREVDGAVRHDEPAYRHVMGRVFNWLVGFLTGVRLHDHNCGFKCYRRAIFDEVHLYGELHRFVPVLAAARGWRVGEIVVNHRARQFGHSKYGVARIVKGFLDLLTVCFITGYGRRPLHLLGTVGLIGFTLGGLGVTVLSLWWILSRLDGPDTNDLHLHERAIFYYSMGALMLGGQFLSVGFLAELITAFHGRESVSYSIRQRTSERS